MKLAPNLASEIDRVVDSLANELALLSDKIFRNPELRYEEVKASGWIADLIAAHGVRVERGVYDLPTALRASVGEGSRQVAVLAEYDALPEIGHACGHNLIATAAVGAFLAAAKVIPKGVGRVTFLGTPAEEGGGGKIQMVRRGAFEGVSAAMMFHPFDRDLLTHPALASLWVSFSFKGSPAHAAAAPHDGTSALTACMDTFRLIDGQRVHFRDGVRVHGYITNGGQAVNIIPEDAACEFSVRARTAEELERVKKIVVRCAEGAAMASGVAMTSEVRMGYRDMRNNEALARRFGDHLRALGRTPQFSTEDVGAGSTDMGDVSHVVPSIHPYLAIVGKNEALCHQHAFAEAAASARGFKTTLVAAKALARTALEFLTDSELHDVAQQEFGKGAS